MAQAKTDDFVGRHLIVDASTYNKRNLTSTDNILGLFEALARNLDMTLVLPPIVCRYPFAHDEMSAFCDETSRAELGSSAISTRGLSKVEITVTTRCRMPPLNWWG